MNPEPGQIWKSEWKCFDGTSGTDYWILLKKINPLENYYCDWLTYSYTYGKNKRILLSDRDNEESKVKFYLVA